MEDVLRMDSKHRIVLTRRLRKAAGIGERDDLIAIPFSGGVIVAAPKGRKFAGSLRGFGFEEEKHQATKYLVKSKTDASSRYPSTLRGS